MKNLKSYRSHPKTRNMVQFMFSAFVELVLTLLILSQCVFYVVVVSKTVNTRNNLCFPNFIFPCARIWVWSPRLQMKRRKHENIRNQLLYCCSYQCIRNRREHVISVIVCGMGNLLSLYLHK